jgi:hypothetical protein
MTVGVEHPGRVVVVVRLALQGAASVAAFLVTTEAMVAERPEKAGAPSMPGGGGMGGLGGMGGMDFLRQRAPSLPTQKKECGRSSDQFSNRSTPT